MLKKLLQATIFKFRRQSKVRRSWSSTTRSLLNPKNLKRVPPVLSLIAALAVVVWYFKFDPFQGIDIYPKADPSLTNGTITVPASAETASFVLTLDKETISYNGELSIVSTTYAQDLASGPSLKFDKDGTSVTAEVKNSSGNLAQNLSLSLNPDSTNPEISVSKNPGAQFLPGEYNLYVTLNKNGKEKTITQNFAWGVLAINSLKSVYLPGEEAQFAFGVLDENGKTICDASLVLEIETPSGEKQLLDTDSGSITRNSACIGDTKIMVPDYSSSYRVSTAGSYKLRLTATTSNGKFFIQDELTVQESVPFEVERTQYPTRIFPAEPYEVVVTVTANQDFTGRVVDIVPASFEVSKTDARVFPPINNKKVIEWYLSLTAGETKTFTYTIKFPEVSPDFYLVGPLTFNTDDGNVPFKEARQWQIASDAVVVSGGITSAEAQFGGMQRKVVYVNSNWYAFYNDGADVWYRKSADGATWGSAVDIDSTDADNYNPTVSASGNIIHVFWVDDGAEVIEGKRIDTGSSDAQGTLCQTSSQGTLSSSFMPSVAALSTTEVVLAYSDTSSDTEVDLFEIASLDGTCSVTDVQPGNIIFGSGITSGDRPVLVPLSSTKVAMVSQDGDLSYAEYDAAENEWKANNATLASVTDNSYSVVSDGAATPRTWILSQDSSNTTDTNFYSISSEGNTGFEETIVNADLGGNDQDGLQDLDMFCIAANDCKLVYVRNMDTTTPDLIFYDCNNSDCSTGTSIAVDTDCGNTGTQCNPRIHCSALDECSIVYFEVATAPDIFFVDCDGAANGTNACSTRTIANTDADFGGGTSTTHLDIDCPTNTNCKFIYSDDDTNTIMFVDCGDDECATTTDTLTSITTINYGTSVVGSNLALDCPTSTTCKILAHDIDSGTVVLVDCSTAGTPETCASPPAATIIQTNVGTTADRVPLDIDCHSDHTDCKILYGNDTSNNMRFADCNDTDCDSPTITTIDANGLDNNVRTDVDLYCVSATDCKFLYGGALASGAQELYFVDCDDAACTTGSVIDTLGPRYKSALSCAAGSTDCKMLYYEGTSTTPPDLVFADCDTTNCYPSVTDDADPWTAETNVSGISLTYDSSNSDLIASILMDASETPYFISSDATTISWSGESAYDGFTAAGDMDHLSTPEIVAGTNQMGALARQSTNLEFDLLAAGSPSIEQNHFRIRDDSTDLNTDGGWLAAQDTSYSNSEVGETYRLRMEIANTGSGSATNYDYRLEYAVNSGTCAGSTFATIPISATDQPFEMADSNLYSSSNAISASRLSATGSFVNGVAVEDPNNSSSNHTLSGSQYSEFEFAITPTVHASPSDSYCFRLTNAGSTTNFTYSAYPELSVIEQEELFHWGFNEATGTTANNSLNSNYHGNLTTAGGMGGPTKVDDASNFGAMAGAGRQVVRTSGGVLYAALNRAGTLEVWKSTDGTTWSEQDTADSPASVAGDEVAIAIDSTDVIHILYVKNDVSAEDMMYVTFSASTDQFGSPEQIEAGNDFDGHFMSLLAIAVDSNDIPHISYKSQPGGGSASAYYSNRIGGDWTLINRGAGTLANIDQTINEDNIPEASYRNILDNDLVGILGNQNDATSFTSQTIDSDISSASTTSIAVDSSGNTWIAYVDENGASDYITLVKHNDGDGWSTWQTPVTNSNVGTEPSIAINGTDVYVFYEDENDDIVYDMYNGSTWLGETVLQTGTFQDAKAKWSTLNNNGGSTQLDYLYSDDADVYWASVGLSGGGDGEAPSWVTSECVFSACLSFDGTSSVVTMPNSVGIKSISFWAKPSSDTTSLIQLSSTAYINASGGTLSATGFSSPTFYVNGQRSKTITANEWNHIVVTTNSTVSASNFALGKDSSSYYSGLMDEVKAYSIVLSASEVRGQHVAKGASDPVSASLGESSTNLTPPVAYWKMDDGTGSSAVDSSGNGNTAQLGASTASPAWSPGKIGNALRFDGSNDSLQSSTVTNITGNLSTMTISVWVRPTSNSHVDYARVIQGMNGTTANFILHMMGPIYGANQGKLTFYVDADSTNCQVNSTALTLNTWHHILVTYDGSSTKIYQNGKLTGTKTGCSKDAIDTISYIDIGSNSNNLTNSVWQGDLDQVKIYNYVLNQEQIFADMNESNPLENAIIGEWRFDEGYGTTLSNSSSKGSSLNGTLGASSAAPAWSNQGKFGKALDFDGTDDYVTLGDNSALELNFPLTISAWVNLDTLPSTDEDYGIISKYYSITNDREWTFSIDSTNTVQFTKSENGQGGTRTAVNANTPFTSNDLGQWVHVMISIDSSGNYTFYRNGHPDGGGTFSTSTIHADIAEVMIGAMNSSSSTPDLFFDGKIDEVRVYDTSLTANQAKSEFNRTHSATLGSQSTTSNGITLDNSTQREYCLPGDTSTCNPPLAEWKMDEGTGSSANDTSTNANVAALNASSTTPAWTNGKKGNALSFDGSDDYALVTNNINLTSAATITGWVKPRGLSANRPIISKRNGSTLNNFQLYIDTDTDRFYYCLWGTSNPCSDVDNFFTANTWVYFAITYDGSNIRVYKNGQLVSTSASTGNITNSDIDTRIGNDWYSHTFDGLIDEIRIYDYSRTSAQIAWEYDKGEPVAHYKLDECQGTTAYDSTSTANDSPTGNNGTITIGGTGTNDGTGTCSGDSSEAWANGNVGKRGSSLSFDGTDDYITIPSANTFGIRDDITLSAWIKRNSLTQKGILIVKTDGSNYDFELGIDGASDNDKLYFYADAPNWFYQAADRTIADTDWHHVAFTRRGTLATLYIDGNEAGTAIASGQFNNNSVPVLIGSDIETAFFSGQIDDVRIYNYALTPTQLKTVINSGAVRFD